VEWSDRTPYFVTLVAIAGVVITVGLVSGVLRRRLDFSAPLLATALGVALGPNALGWIDLPRWFDVHAFLMELARFTIGLGVMTIALRIPRRWPWTSRRGVAVVLGVVMPLMWLVSGLLAYGLLPLSFWSAMLIGAVVTPTDPIISTALITGDLAERALPERLRILLSAESGANDGLAYPMVLLAIGELESSGMAHWFWHAIVVEIFGAAALGALLGWGTGHVLAFAKRHEYVQRVSVLAFTVALTILVLGVGRLLSVDGLLAVFTSGLLFRSRLPKDAVNDARRVQDAVNQFFVLPFFLFVGTLLPWSDWLARGWRLPLLVAGVLLLRRMPAMLAVRGLVPQLRDRGDALFAGWFGPIGVAAVFYALLAADRTKMPVVWTVTSLLFANSVVVHGMTATPFTRLYGRHRPSDASTVH
jgi:NhaP-type Na+/H+ or K+/H+ antiporter